MKKGIISGFLVVAMIILVIHIAPTKNIVIDNVDDYSMISSKKLVALTFDDGPSEYTEKLLCGLKERNVKCTFFLLGKHIDNYSDIVKMMYDDGHLMGNHTYSHKSMFKTKLSTTISEIKKTDDIIKNITGETTKFFRPPYGKYTSIELKSISKVDVLWSFDTIDWKHKDAEKDVDYVFNSLVTKATDGDIILMHDTNEATVNGVLRAIDYLSENGFQFVRVDELLNRNGQPIKSGIAYRLCKNKDFQIYF